MCMPSLLHSLPKPPGYMPCCVLYCYVLGQCIPDHIFGFKVYTFASNFSSGQLLKWPKPQSRVLFSKLQVQSILAASGLWGFFPHQNTPSGRGLVYRMGWG